MTKILLTSISLLLFLLNINGQTAKIEGRVTNDAGPVAGAEVILKSPETNRPVQTTFSDASGAFTFNASGTFIVEARSTRNGTLFFAKAIVTSDSQTELRLEPAKLVNETVIVSADTEQSVQNVSKSVDTISALELRERADITLVDAIRIIPGIRIQQLGGFGRLATIKSRGLRNQDTALLLDGVRLRDSSAITGDASPFLADITLTSVNEIEVLRGPGSSLYGTNAIGGTIDFRTPAPTPGFHGQVSAGGGGLGLARFRANISDGTENGRFTYGLGVSRTAYTKGIDGNDNAHNTNFQSRIDFRPDTSSLLSTRFFVSDAYVRLNSNPDTRGTLPASNNTIIVAKPGVNFTPDADDPDDRQFSQFFNAQIVYSHAINDKLAFRGLYSGLSTRRRNESGPLGVGFQSSSTSIFKGQIHTANISFDFTPNRFQNFRFGYEFEDEKFENIGLTPTGNGNFFTRVSQGSDTLFVQDLANAFDGRLQLAGGVRFQRFRLGDPVFSLQNAPYGNIISKNPPSAVTFDGAASYFFRTSQTKLRLHFGSGYRVPSLYERFGSFFSNFFGPQFIALGDPDLKPEKAAAIDAGVEQYFFSGRAVVSATYFYTRLIDTIGFGNVVRNIGSTSRPFGGYVNQKGGISRGGEFSLRLKARRATDVFASYTYVNSDQREPQVSGSGIVRTLGIPSHAFTLSATQRFKRFWLNFDLTAESSYLAPIFSNSVFSTYVYRFKGNRRGDITAGYTIPLQSERFSLRLFGTIENLFGFKYYENGFKTIGRTGRIGASFQF
ncbi:MAG: TonB-dependent receptor plug domain-containing protein [Pyrinomonadaceae bacterium]